MKHIVNTTIERPDADLVARARDTRACAAGEALGWSQQIDNAIRPLRREWRFAGPAVTVLPENPVDTLTGRAAIEQVQPGDVIVINTGGRMDAACWGATMAWGAKEAGAAGAVVDGAVLTTELLIDHEGLPVFCRGSTTGHAGGTQPGSINVPIVCGGIIVNPGDIVLADEDGVVVIPRGRAADILDAAGQGRRDAYPPVGRKKAFDARGYADTLKGFDSVDWR